MLRWQRPPKPENFEERAAPRRQALRDAIAQGAAFEHDDNFWRSFKGDFETAQHRKCAYCDQKDTGGVGGVDHFRPKSSLSCLEAAGREDPRTKNFADRRRRQVCARGYWWLAYSWENWLYVCERCNSWKSDLFPRDDFDGSPTEGTDDFPLILDPFGTLNPADHLRFDDLGAIEAVDGSRVGAETIRTLGLDRESLRDARQQIAELALGLIQLLDEKERSGRDFARELLDLAKLGKAENKDAGMVRILIEQRLRIQWSSLLAPLASS